MTTTKTIADTLTIQMFGPMRAQVGGEPLPRMRSRKGLWLLALLVLRHDRNVAREWLAGTLWPDTDQETAFSNLRPILSELRNGLGAESARLQSPDRHTLRLSLAGADVDVLAFDAAIAGGTPADWERATQLYRGPLLEGCNEEWASQERLIREQQCLTAWQKLGDAAAHAGDWTRAAERYRRVVGMDAWNETARREWMSALAKSGDRNAALQVYREFTTLLRDTPNATPDALTTELVTRLRREARQPTPSPVADVEEPPALPRVTGYLPHALTDLVGREDECEDVAARLRRARLLTLTGTGGIGKTRIAIEVARAIVDEMPHGVWLVALDALPRNSDVAPQIAAALNVTEEPDKPLLAVVTAWIGTKRLLLVLDNCEHVLESSAHAAIALLRDCGNLRILATSREVLNITGEVVWPVPPLTIPEPNALPSQTATLLRVLSGYESVQLFMDRASAVQKSFTLNGANARHVAEICRRLEGLPLAIELAAARVKLLAPEQIAARLNDHLPQTTLQLLTGTSRSSPPRQQTLRATLDWSIALLEPAERDVLYKLSVFAGGCTLEAAERVCAANGIKTSHIIDLLAASVEKSLVASEERNGGRRYRMLEMVRQVAREKLEASGEADAVRRTHRAWIAALAEADDAQVNSARQEAALNELEAEHDNIRAALDGESYDADDAELRLRIVGASWRFWSIRGYHSEGRRWMQRTLEQPQAQAETARRAKALNGAAALAHEQGDFATARSLHQQALPVFRALGNQRGIAASLANQGTLVCGQGDYAAAVTLLQESLSIQRELDHTSGMAQTLQSLGNVHLLQSEYVQAQGCYAESLSLFRALGDRRGAAFLMECFGNLAYLRGAWDVAETHFQEGLALRQELGDQHGIALSLGSVGMMHRDRGDSEAAQALFGECLALFREIGDTQKAALSLVYLSHVAQDTGEVDRAFDLLTDALTTLRQIGDRDGMATALLHLGTVTGRRGDTDAAQSLLRECLTLCHAMSSREGAAASMERLAGVWQAAGRTTDAVRLFGAVQALREQLQVALPPPDLQTHERNLAAARSTLGETAFRTAWEQGSVLTYEQAVALAQTNAS